MLLPFLFFIVAGVYSMAGFGGGSSYIALLILFSVPIEMVPVTALGCNIVAVSSGAVHFISKRLLKFKKTIPFLIGSVPCAYIGGRLMISTTALVAVLALCLCVSGLVLLGVSNDFSEPEKETKRSPFFGSSLGAAIGFLSGMIGIGGGILLSPCLHFLSWGKAKEIAATASFFILVNSVSGIVGQLSKPLAVVSWPLFFSLVVMVFLGSQLGSYLSTRKISSLWIRRITGIILILAAIRLWLI